MNNANQTPAVTSEPGKGTWHPVVEEPMADAVARLRNAHVAEPFKTIINGFFPCVKGSLAVELGFAPDAEER